MSEKQFRNSLQKIISVSFFSLSVIVFLVVCYTLIVVARPLLIKGQQKQVELLGNKIVANLSHSIVATETVAAAIASVYTGMADKSAATIKQIVPGLFDLPESANIIAGGGVWPEPFHFSKDRRLRSFFWGRKDDNRLHYFDDYNDISGAGYHNEKWYVPARYAKTKRGIWSESYVDPYSLQPMVTCTVPMFEKGAFVGVSTVDLKLEGLAELFAKAGNEVDGYLFALDNNNKFLAFPEPGLIRKQDDYGDKELALGFIDSSALGRKEKRFTPVSIAIAEIDQKLIELVKTRTKSYDKLVQTLVHESYQIDHNQARLIAAYLVEPLCEETSLSKKLTSFKVDEDLILHESATVTIFHIPRANWKLAVVVPDSRIAVIVSRIMGKMIFYLAIGLLITLFSAYFLLRIKFLLPLQKITSQLKRIEDEPEQDALELEITSKNELGKLAYHFNRRTRELANSRKRYRDLFDNAKDAIFIHDRESAILDVNQTMLSVFQIPDRETACSLSINDLSYKKNVSNLATELVGKAFAGEPQEFEWSCKRFRDGASFDAMVNLSRSSYAGVTVVIATVTDITEKLRNERELRKVSQLESLGLLAGGIAHDFNNLLSGIFGNISLARMQVSPSSKVDKFLERAEGSLQRTTALTRQLLTFAKGGEPSLMAVDLEDLVLESAEFAVHGSNVKLEVDQSPELWQVYVDKGQIGQVISNLVINAVQAMPDGGVITIKMTNLEESVVPGEGASVQADYVRVSVSDHGNGISSVDLEKIFDPYFTTKANGCGLGLALCFSIVKKHNGFIRVESELGSGTTFNVDLPAVRRVEAVEGVKNKSSLNEGSDHLKVVQKILVMDDDPEIQELMLEMLSLLGHFVVVASEGREAIATYTRAFKDEEKFNLIIVDLTIPGGMGGLETFERLKELDPQIKAVVSSGYSTDPIMANYLDYGFIGAIPKPFTIDGVKKCLEMVADP